LLAQLPRGAYVINVSRGAMVLQADLIAALRSGQISGAALDVFDTEPLPADDPWWREPGVLVTPHISSQPSPLTVAEQLLENIRRLEAGEALLNQVDIARGY
jgi:glyoxylate/hydroxypyruvate reductase A